MRDPDLGPYFWVALRVVIYTVGCNLKVRTLLPKPCASMFLLNYVNLNLVSDWRLYTLSVSKGENIQSYNLFNPLMMIT